jgi:hypothetical protein
MMDQEQQQELLVARQVFNPETQNYDDTAITERSFANSLNPA